MDVGSGEHAEIVLVGDSENSQQQSVDIESTSSVGTLSDDLDTGRTQHSEQLTVWNQTPPVKGHSLQCKK